MKKRELPFSVQHSLLVRKDRFHPPYEDLSHLVGKRVRLIEMVNPPDQRPDPNPIESGTEGVVNHTGGGIINVEWDNGRNLGMVHGTDRYVVLD